jgi:Tfp pilus assembly protein PilO
MRKLRTSEIILLLLTFVTIFTVVNVIVWKRYQKRITTAEDKIGTLEEQLQTNLALEQDKGFWDQRSAWLDGRMPRMGDFGDLQSRLLEDVQQAAADRGITFETQALNKPEGGSPYHREVSVTVLAEGPDQAIYKWLSEWQSPEKFQAIRSIRLFNDVGPQNEPQMDCQITLSRWYRP